MQEQLHFVLCCFFQTSIPMSRSNSCQEQTAPLPAQCQELGGQKSLAAFLTTNNSIPFQREDKTTPTWATLLGFQSQDRAGLETKNSWGHPSHGTRISFHCKPCGRICPLKSPNVKEQSQSTLRKSLSSLNSGGKRSVNPNIQT